MREPIAAAGFYEQAVGPEPVRVTEYAAGQAPFPSVRLNEETIIDLMPLALAETMTMTMVPGAAAGAGHPVDHVCLARHFRDPDGNVFEARHYA